MVSVTLSALPPGKENQNALYRRMGGTQGRPGRLGKVPSAPGIRTPDHPGRSGLLYQLSYPGCLYVTAL